MDVCWFANPACLAANAFCQQPGLGRGIVRDMDRDPGIFLVVGVEQGTACLLAGIFKFQTMLDIAGYMVALPYLYDNSFAFGLAKCTVSDQCLDVSSRRC